MTAAPRAEPVTVQAATVPIATTALPPRKGSQAGIVTTIAAPVANDAAAPAAAPLIPPWRALRSTFAWTSLSESMAKLLLTVLLVYLALSLIASGDPERAMRVARRIRTGTLGINGAQWQDVARPFGGVLFGVDALREVGATVDGRVFLVGGGSRSVAYRQRCADLLGAPITVPDADETVATGAAEGGLTRAHIHRFESSADAAPFVSGGTQNTTWSILAMAWRTMDRLQEDLRGGAI